MTWTTIAEVAADNPVTDGTQVSSSVWNSQVKGNLEHLYSVPRCVAYKSAAQSISTGSWQDVTWDSESFDTASIHDTSTNTERFTLVRDGLWLVVAQVVFASNSTGDRLGRLLLNGVGGAPLSQVNLHTASGNTTRFTVQTLVYTSTTTDYVGLQVYQDSGGALNLSGGSAASTSLSVVWLGA